MIPVEKSFVFFIFLVFDFVHGKNISSLDRLFNKIFIEDQYSNMVRPYGDDELTHVHTELKLLQIDLDEKYQELISTVWIEMTWIDQRLSWNPDDFNGIKEVTLGVEKIWFPDIVLQNGVGHNDYLNEFKYFNPWILHNGLVTWVPEVRLHTKCVIKVKDFPFDTQCCEVNFYSWAHTASQMVIKQFGNKNTTNLTHLAYNTEWNIYDTCALNATIKTSQDLEWWITSYVIYIKRESIYHIYTLLMPCGVLSLLSILLFWLPPDSDEKITLGVTILLAFFVNSLVVSNYTPEAASDLPVIGTYYTFNIFVVAMSLSASVFILKLHFRGHKLTKVPDWVKKVLFMKKNISINKLNWNDKKMITYNLFGKLSAETRLVRRYSISKEIYSKEYTQLHKILKLLKYSFKKYENEKKKTNETEEIIIEWKEVARRLEYVFLIIVFLIITITPIILFSKYFIHSEKHLSIRRCSCEHSFIHSV